MAAQTKTPATRKPSRAVRTGNTGKAITPSDLKGLEAVFGVGADKELARVAFVGTFVQRGFSGNAIADGFIRRAAASGKRVPTGFNRATVQYYVGVYRATSEGMPKLSPAQAANVAADLMSIVGANKADGGAAEGLAATVAAIKAASNGADAARIARDAERAVATARSTRLATPAARPVGGTARVQGLKADADETAEETAPATRMRKVNDDTPALGGISTARLFTELTRRVEMGEFTPADLHALDQFAAFAEEAFAATLTGAESAE